MSGIQDNIALGFDPSQGAAPSYKQEEFAYLAQACLASQLARTRPKLKRVANID